MSKVNFSIEGDSTTYVIPLDLSEVTLQKYIDFCNLEAKYLPKELKRLRELYTALTEIPVTDKLDREPIEAEIEELNTVVESFEYRVPLLEWYAAVVEFWTGLPYDKIMGLDNGGGMQVHQLQALYYKLEQLNLPPEKTEYSNIIEWQGEAWYLPSQFMRDATTIEYLEASQFQKLADELAGNQWGVMGKIMAIIVRKKDEKYNSQLVADREQFFLSWTMDKVYQVAFFLLTRMEKLTAVLGTYQAAQTLSKLRQESKT